MKTIEYHSAFLIKKITKHAIPMPSNTTPNEIWMSKEEGGFGINTCTTTDGIAKITCLNRILSNPHSTAHKTIIQRLEDDTSINKTPFPDVQGGIILETQSSPPNSLWSAYITAANQINNQENNTIYTWTDGSKQKEGVSVGIFHKLNSPLNLGLGLNKFFLNEEAELTAAQIAISDCPPGTNVLVFSDNQCHRPLNRLKETIKDRKRSNPQHQIRAVHIPSHIDRKMLKGEKEARKVARALETLQKEFLTTDWIILGNEQADKLAGEAALQGKKLPTHLAGSYPVERSHHHWPLLQ